MSEQKTLLDRIKSEFPEQVFVEMEGCDDAVIGIQYGTLRLIYSYQKLYNALVLSGKNKNDANYTLWDSDKIKTGLVVLCYDKFDE